MSSELTAIKGLKPYFKNPRKGDVKAIAESLDTLGQYRPITVNRGTYTGRPNEVLTGNHTLKAAKSLGWSEIAVAWVDVDEDRANQIVVLDNRTADLGTYDNDVLADLLGDLPDLDGTGYTDDDVQDLLIGLEDPEEFEPPTPGGASEGGTPTPSETPSEENRWELASRKTIILGYPVARFVWVTEKLAQLGKAYGTKSNAEALQRLLEDAK